MALSYENSHSPFDVAGVPLGLPRPHPTGAVLAGKDGVDAAVRILNEPDGWVVDQEQPPAQLLEPAGLHRRQRVGGRTNWLCHVDQSARANVVPAGGWGWPVVRPRR